MDFSGFGMMFVACCFVTFIPPLIAAIAWLVIYAIRKAQGVTIERTQGTILFLILYGLSVIASCVFIYFSYLKYMYVM